MLCNRELQVLNSAKENDKIKSGAFDEYGSFIYSTSSHLKYVLPYRNTHGTFKSLQQPQYLIHVSFLHLVTIVSTLGTKPSV